MWNRVCVKNIFIRFVSKTGEIDTDRFNTNFGDIGLEEGIKIIKTSDGGYAILGNSKFGSDQKLVLIKLDSNGELK